MFKKMCGFLLVVFCMLAFTGVAQADYSYEPGYGPPGLEYVAVYIDNVDVMVYALALDAEPAMLDINLITVPANFTLPVVNASLPKSIGSVLCSYHRARQYLPDIV